MKLGSQEIDPIGIIRYVSIVKETTVTTKAEDVLRLARIKKNKSLFSDAIAFAWRCIESGRTIVLRELKTQFIFPFKN